MARKKTRNRTRIEEIEKSFATLAYNLTLPDKHKIILSYRAEGKKGNKG